MISAKKFKMIVENFSLPMLFTCFLNAIKNHGFQQRYKQNSDKDLWVDQMIKQDGCVQSKIPRKALQFKFSQRTLLRNNLEYR